MTEMQECKHAIFETRIALEKIRNYVEIRGVSDMWYILHGYHYHQVGRMPFSGEGIYCSVGGDDERENTLSELAAIFGYDDYEYGGREFILSEIVERYFITPVYHSDLPIEEQSPHIHPDETVFYIITAKNLIDFINYHLKTTFNW